MANEQDLQSELASLFKTDETVKGIALAFLTPFYGGLIDVAKADLELGEVWAFVKLLDVLDLVPGYYGTTNIRLMYVQLTIERINQVLAKHETDRDKQKQEYQKFLAYQE